MYSRITAGFKVNSSGRCRRKLRKIFSINKKDSNVVWGRGCRNTGLDKEQEQLSLVTQDSKVQVLKRDQRARLDLHSEHCTKGLSTMLLMEVHSSPDQETDLTTEHYTVTTKTSQEYGWWTKLRTENRKNSDKTEKVSTFPSGSSDAPEIINWSGKWRPYGVNTLLGSSSSCLGLIACEKLSLSYNHVEETGRKTALTSIGSDLQKVTGNNLFSLKQKQVVSELNSDSNKNSSVPGVRLEPEYNFKKASDNIVQSGSYNSCTVPGCTIQLREESTSPAVDASFRAGLVRQKPNDPGFALLKFEQCDSSVVNLVVKTGSKLNSAGTTLKLNNELDMLLPYKRVESCGNEISNLGSKKMSYEIEAELEPERIKSFTDEMSADLPSKDQLVRVDQANQVAPQDLFSCIHHQEAEDSVLETSEGLIDIGLAESYLGKEQRTQCLSG
jgi:hypothetical protein